MQLVEVRAFVACHTCRVKHRLPHDYYKAQVDHVEFRLRHRGHRVRLHRGGFQSYADNANVKEAFGTSNQAIACTITSLANNGQRQSTAVDNTSNLFLEVLIAGKIKSGGSGTAATGTAVIYAYATADGGTTYGDTVTGTDGTVTLTSPPNLMVIGTLNMVANSTSYALDPLPLSQRYNMIPDHWGVVVQNLSGGTFDASIASLWYQGSYATVI